LATHLSVGQHAALAAIGGGASIAAAAEAAAVNRVTIYRWIKFDPIFRAAYNAWQHTIRESAAARLVRLADEAVDTVTKAVQKGDQKLAYALLKDLGLLRRTQQTATDPDLIKRQIQVERDEQEMAVEQREEKSYLAR